MGDSYVVKGAKLKCSCGDQECSLQPINHDSKINGKEQANILDFAPLVNVPPFGMCNSMLNPALIAAKAASNGAVQKVPCIPVIPAPWLGGKTNKLVKGAPALLKSSTLMCAYMGQIKIQDDGMGGHDQIGAKGAKVASEKQESKSEELKEENKRADESEQNNKFEKKTNVQVIVELKFSSDYAEHLKSVKKFDRNATKGIIGGHNMDEFKNYFKTKEGLDEKDFIERIDHHPYFEGIYEITYKVPLKDDKSGKYIIPPTSYKIFKKPKTVYDPSKISDQDILKWGEEAMRDGISKNTIDGNMITGTAANGLKFEGWINRDVKDAIEVRNFYPILN